MPLTKKKNILVTGVGAIIGYGVIRSLRQCDAPSRIIGIDIFSDAVGQHWCDDFRQALKTNDPEYLSFIRKIVNEFKIDLIIPCIEQDISFWANNISKFTDTQIVLNSSDLIFLSDDKWLTHQALAQNNFSAIPTVIDGTFSGLSKKLGLPFLIKPRRSYASKGIEIIHDATDFKYWRQKLGSNFMAQKIVGSNEDEYTCGVFGDGAGGILAHICFRRKLSAEGATAKAEVVFDQRLTKKLEQLAELFKPKGPCNFQFRQHENEFLLLEINPRISSSTSLRTAFGYNEARLCIDFYLDKKEIQQPVIQTGKAIRYIEDMLLS